MTNNFDAIANDAMPLLMRYSDQFTEWTLEYPGYVALRTESGGVWNIGTASGTWGADFFIYEDTHVAGDQPDHSVDTYIRADCPDPSVIAEALFNAMTAIHAKA